MITPHFPRFTVGFAVVCLALVSTGGFVRPVRALAPGLPTPAGVPLNPIPRLVDVTPVAPGVLALRIQEGEVRAHELAPYVPHPSDRIVEEQSHGLVVGRRVERGSQTLGYLTGSAGDTLLLPDQYAGVPVDGARLEATASYRLSSERDPRYAQPREPQWVARKSKPNLFARNQRTVGVLHTVYLSFGDDLQEGARYQLALPDLPLREQQVTYVHEPARTRSEAVHVNQNGFAPRDPVKCAYVSLWLGARGGLAFPSSLRYHVVDEIRGRRVWSGTAGVHWPAERPELMYRETNHVGADVYRLDFSSVTAPGRYHVYVEGVGRSHSFEINDSVWQHAVSTSVRGVYLHRSGIELGPPHTDFRRPRPHHPDDGVRVMASRATLLDTSMGLDLQNRDSFRALAEEATGEELPHAWGGMMDAGDWDRRTQHLIIPRIFLELYELAPEYFGRLDLNIPESANDLPDLVDEGLWILDAHLRLQTAEGGVRGGIESAAHPTKGDVSWAETIPVYAYAPDFWSTHELVATAARAAAVLRERWPERAAGYAEAALRGMAWAEAAYADWRADETVKRRPEAVREARNLAALELYRMTGDDRWHRVFLEDTVLLGATRRESGAQRDALFTYARLPVELGRPDLRQQARETLLADAAACLTFQSHNAFALAARDRTRPPYLGFYSGAVDAHALVRGHVLSGDARYHAGLLAATQFALGANPDNLSYTTGLGSHTPNWVLHEDSLKTGRPAPPGITVYGPFDHSGAFITPGSWWFIGFEGLANGDHQMVPRLRDWPVVESYVDIWNFIAQNEYTPWQTMAPAAYVWGYLAALTAASP
jgi:endoglucanase